MPSFKIYPCLNSPQKGFFWRRERDSNPRPLAESLVFKTSSINHSDISPHIIHPMDDVYSNTEEEVCQPVLRFESGISSYKKQTAAGTPFVRRFHASVSHANRVARQEMCSLPVVGGEKVIGNSGAVFRKVIGGPRFIGIV